MKKKIAYTFFAFFNLVFAENSRLDKILINSKKNGIILELTSNSNIENKSITGWQSNSGWFYITLYEFYGDSAIFYPKNIPDIISDFQIIKLDKSIQIGIKTSHSIDNFEYQTSNSKNKIVTILHYSNEILSSIVSNYPTMDSINSNKKLNSIKKWLYLTGITTTTSSFLYNDNLKNLQTIAGSAIIAITIIFDLIGIF